MTNDKWQNSHNKYHREYMEMETSIENFCVDTDLSVKDKDI